MEFNGRLNTWRIVFGEKQPLNDVKRRFWDGQNFGYGTTKPVPEQKSIFPFRTLNIQLSLLQWRRRMHCFVSKSATALEKIKKLIPSALNHTRSALVEVHTIYLACLAQVMIFRGKGTITWNKSWDFHIKSAFPTWLHQNFLWENFPIVAPGEDIMLRPGQVPEAKKPKAPTGWVLVSIGVRETSKFGHLKDGEWENRIYSNHW